MRKFVCLIVLMLLLLGTVTFFNDAEGVDLTAVERRSIEVPYTLEPPVLDGDIDDVEWHSEFATHYYDAFDGECFREIYPVGGSDEEFTNQSELAVTFYMLYDDTYLYFAANVTDDRIIVDSGATYYRDDGVELLLDGAHDRDVDQRAGDPWPGYQDGTTLLAVADGSTFHDYSSGTPYERNFGSDWYAATSVHVPENYYIVEMKIRLDAIASPLPNSTIGLNIGVNDDDTGGLSKTALKWEGSETLPGENPTYKNETLWGEARLVPYVNASLPERIYVDEDVEVHVLSNSSSGNHPDFGIGAGYRWTMPLYAGGTWQNVSRNGPVFTYTFDQPRSFYLLHLTVTDPSGESDDAITYIHVADVTPPELNGADAVALEEEPYTYQLNVTDNVDVRNVTWSLFDDVWFNETTGPSFLHTYQHPGLYELFYVVLDTSGNSAEGSSNITVLDFRPPFVPEMANVEMNTSAVFSVNASGSFDDTPEGQSSDLFFNWTVFNLWKSYKFFGAFVNLSIGVPGTYNGDLTVSDINNFSTGREFTVVVSDTTAPVPEIIVPNIVDEGENISLDAGATTDNDPELWNGITVEWTIEQPSQEVYFQSDEEEVNFSFPGPGVAYITLTVTDPSENTGTITVQIEVQDAVPPSLVLHVPDTVPQNVPFLINISGSSDRSGIMSVHYTVHKNVSGDLLLVMETPPFGIRVRYVDPAEFGSIEDMTIRLEDPGNYLLEVRLMDVHNLTSSAKRQIEVLDTTPPEAVLNRTYAAVLEGELLVLSASESTDDIGPLTYRWLLDGDLLDAEGPEFGYLFSEKGRHNITVVASDGQGNEGTASCIVDVVELPVSTHGSSNAMILIWAFTISILILATLFIFLWARNKKKIYMEGLKEE
ncbi:MAG: sugar-binding protein [Candidatus Thermoplasmatota archaeon]|nr:sugar-binding protein [Candidatus Thermoplasmatota archaeon]